MNICRVTNIDDASPQPNISFAVLENLLSHFIFIEENKSTSFHEVFAEFYSHREKTTAVLKNYNISITSQTDEIRG